MSIDDFFCDKCVYYLGIDGGTKTDFVLADDKLNIIKKLRTEGCNPIDIDPEGEEDDGNAGTAQKLVLNMLSSCSMIKTGKVYENLMINLKPTNIKLRKRVISIVCEICSCTRKEAMANLDKNNRSIRDAIDMYKNGGK